MHFGETVSIFVSLTYFNGVRASFRYQLRTADGTLTTEAESSHCFLWQGKAPIDLKKRFPALCELAREAAEES